MSAYIRSYPATAQYLFLAAYTLLYLSTVGRWVG